MESAACSCYWDECTAKHVVFERERWMRDREETYRRVGKGLNAGDKIDEMVEFKRV